MFCHNCGFKTESISCPDCGTKMVESDSIIIKSWRKESDLKELARHPDVIGYISNHAEFSNKKISSEYLLDKFDLIFGTFTGVSSNLIMEIGLPIYKKLGIKTGKEDIGVFNEPINELFVKVLCSISANKKLEFKEFYQAKDGLLVVSLIKPDLISYKGNLMIELQESDNGVVVKINAIIKGQVYDFGKSKKIVSQVLSDLKTIELKSYTP